MEIIELIINLSIAIIALDISIYALSVTLLGSQLRRNEFYVKKRLKETEEEIKRIQENNLSAEERLSGIEQKIKHYKKDAKELSKKLKCLTLKGAVLYPIIPVVINLVLGAILLIISLPTDLVLYMLSLMDLVLIFSSFLFAIGAFKTFCTLQSIEFAVTHTPLPNFDVDFALNSKTSLEIEHEKKLLISIDVTNSGYDYGELVEVAIFFPPQFKVYQSAFYQAIKQTDYPNQLHPKYTAVMIAEEILHVDTTATIDVSVKSPTRADNYKIPVYLNEKKVTQEEYELELVVT